ncbi:immune inhibitor A [Mumia sp. ZJ1417]|uniref:immune inhibitor A domain-containing protein n=1 Tax=Mumia sp. ZJ1417 TaxID=2708082 RepID=UPI001420CC6E|nr:immune inhibitor A domain-containing protein [Mumia sp. ZJ1417]QMW66483.1 immune inhibitor A [Mumia sp. ZJ1417]
MRRLSTALITLGVTASFGAVYASPGSAEPAPPVTAADRTDKEHELPNPLEDKRRALREEAITSVVNGDATPVTKNGSSVVKVGKSYSPAEAAALGSARGRKALAKAGKKAEKQDQYVEIEQERADKIFVVLTEFGDERHPDFPDDGWNVTGEDVEPQRFDGPIHNQIPEPDRTKDNSTVWQPDYNREHFQDLYFADGKNDESVKTYYEAQSSGRYTVDGTVADWVKVPYNQARYGRLKADGTETNAWDLIRDAVTAWVADQKAAGKTDDEIKSELATYDTYDRYDFDGDGDFNESDGYIDHFQIVHAGGDEADGDPIYGSDALWSHRWYAFVTDAGITGPEQNPLGGAEIGDTGIWVGDYTIQPENGGLSVFVHEYGHDLGLPDAYDTSNKGDNSNEYWTLMAQSRLNDAGEPLGTRPGDLGAWEKLQLGWLDYEVVAATQKKKLELGPQEWNSKKAQGAVVVLPKKQVTRSYGAPASGTKQFFSGAADDLANAMTTELDLTGKASASFTAKARWDIEKGYDYAYFQASTDGGKSWTSLAGTVDGAAFGTDASGAPALDGAHPAWGDVVVPLDAYAGQKILFRSYYKTDGGLTRPGLFLDDVAVTADGATLLSDGAEDGGAAWTFAGYSIVGESTTLPYDNYYVMGHRSYVGYDKYLQTGPYNFGFLNTKPDWVEHYRYGQGLLISYWDTSVADNNTTDHPGQGRNLPIDAHPEPIINIATGAPWRARIQVYDAPFGLKKADSMTLHTNGKPSYVRAQPAQSTFNDTKKYWYAELPNHGVKLPAVGVKVKVLEQKGTSMTIKIN